MRRVAPVFVAALLAGLVAGGAAAFNPTPRPLPTGVSGKCSNDLATECVDQFDCADEAACVADPADVVPNVAVRGTLTFVSDEDVTSWNQGVDNSATRFQRARLTLLLQYERAGQLRTFAEIYDLSSEACAFQTEPPTEEAALCVPDGVGWSQPADERRITSDELLVVFSSPGSEVAKAIAVDLTGDLNTAARPFLEIVDRLPETTSDHQDTVDLGSGTVLARDPLASAQQLKVTIRLRP
jgi:hypothetical protein